MSDQPKVRIDVQCQPSAVYVIRVDGELIEDGECLYLDMILREAEEIAAADHIVLDLERVTCVGSKGLRVLVDAGRRSASDGNRLQMTRGIGHLADTMRLTALDQTLPMADPALLPAIRGGEPRGRRSPDARGQWKPAMDEKRHFADTG